MLTTQVHVCHRLPLARPPPCAPPTPAMDVRSMCTAAPAADVDALLLCSCDSVEEMNVSSNQCLM